MAFQLAAPAPPHQVKWLEDLVATIFVFNALDGLLTIAWVTTGLAQEANPLMDPLLAFHPALFMVAKLTLVGLGSLLLWRHRTKPSAVIGIVGLFMAYYLLLLYHLEAFGHLLGLVMVEAL